MKKLLSCVLILTLLMSTVCLADDTWTCPLCGQKDLSGKYCGKCGAARPDQENYWACPNCGAENTTTKFCGECGSKRPEVENGWTCPNCGTKGNTTKFCGECGSQKPLDNVKTGAWNGFVPGDNFVLNGDILKLNAGCEGTSFDVYLEDVMSLIVSTEVALGYQAYTVYIFGETFAKNAGINLADSCIGNPNVAFFTSETIEEEKKAILWKTIAKLLETKDLPIYLLTVENNEYPMTITVTRTCNVRSGAGTNFRLLGELSGGTTVKSKGTVSAADGTGNWYEIEYKGENAFINASVVMNDTANTTPTQPEKKNTPNTPDTPSTPKVDPPAPTPSKTWSAWSAWSQTRQSPSGTEGVDWKVETKTEEQHTYKTVYCYSHYKYIGQNGNNWYGPIDMSNTKNYLRNGRWEYKTSDTQLPKKGTASAGGKSYAYYGDNYWYNETTKEEIASTTVVTYYRYSYYR